MLFVNYIENLQMSSEIKSRICRIVEGIEDETVLKQLMEDVAFYASKTDIIDDLTTEQLEDLDKAIEEADKNETISWDDF